MLPEDHAAGFSTAEADGLLISKRVLRETTPMQSIDLPDQKMKLWTAMREDLMLYLPAFRDNDKLICPICCRSLKYEQFSVEHILPQQAVKTDPSDVQAAIVKNVRSGLTLLCSETLTVNGKAHAKGCNGWKGRHFDSHIATLFKPGPFPSQFSDGHIIAFLMVGYLGLFKQYGYRVALTEGGLVLRNQFFNPRRFTKNLPITSQMVLRADPRTKYSSEAHAYWSEPVKVYSEGRRATVLIRNYSAILTLSHDPTIPIARNLSYVPGKYAFRPDLRLAFQ